MRQVIFVVATAAVLAGCSSAPAAKSEPREAPPSHRSEVAPETSAAVADPTTLPPPSEVTTPEGLVYTDLVAGTGAAPTVGQVVTVHYVGTFLDGKKFDSSRDRGEPFSFPLGLGKVIKGWDIGVASMAVGGKRKLVIPPGLAYGAEGYPGAVPPNSTLVFEVELLGVDAPAPVKTAPAPADRKPDPVTTPEGVECTDLVVGTGASPAKGQVIVVHYEGTLTDGSVFDSSRKTGEPLTFRFDTGNVIKGWDIGLAGMKVGGKRKLVIPPALGYGVDGSPPEIPANSTLIFVVELLEVRP